MPNLRSSTMAEESQVPEDTKVKIKKVPKEQDQWLMIAPDTLLDNPDGDKVLLKLPHPQNGVACLFAFHEKKVFELMKFNDDYRSWFINDTVQKDGSLTFITPIDPLFLALPFIEKAAEQGNFTTLDNILVEPDYSPALLKLEECLTKQCLMQICTCKGDDEFVVYKADNDKILQWLVTKVQRVAAHVKSSKIGVCPGASSNFNRTGSKSESDCLRYAWTVVSDYITPSWSVKLKDKLGVTDPIKEVKEVKDDTSQPSKKQKLNNNTEGVVEDYRDHTAKKIEKKPSKVSASQKSLEKVNKKGMKSMTSFFKAKPKK